MRTPGLRAVHASKHVFRSDSIKRESKLRAAWFAPEQFETGVVQAYAFPIRPTSKKAWETLLTVTFPIPLEMLIRGNQTRDFGALVLDGQQVVHRFTRRLTVQPENTDVEGLPRITFLEPITLKPGHYTLKVVMSDPNGVDPHATVVSIDVPEIPRRELFIVGPILARTAGPNLVVMGDAVGGDHAGNANSFEPMLVQMVDEPQNLIFLTQACAVGKSKQPDGELTRALLSADGQVVGSLESVPLALEGEGKVRCQNLLDVVPGSAIGQNGDYVFEAQLGLTTGDAPTGRVRFAVGTDD
jgi:hypothetical protein